MCFRQTLMMSSLWISSLLQLLPRNGVDGDQHMTRLFHQLLIDYNKEIRPVIQHNRPVNTSIAFSLVQVVDVDERNQLLTSLAWIHFRWNDWRLAWDPQLNGRLTKLNVPVESIWIPDIILYNNAAQEYLKEMTTASVTYDGNISLSMAGIFKSSCALDVRFYPFDFQSCLMKFASWAYDGTKIDIWSESKGDQSNYMVSTEWTLRDVRAEKNSVIYSCCPEPYPFIDVHLLLERKPLFFVIFLCLPCVLISLLVLLGFYMPSDSGEKVTLGITSLLSTTVFLMLVSEHLPPTADALPLIGIYYGVTIFIVSLQTAFTVFTLNIHHIGTHGRPVPPLLQHLLFGRFSNLLMLNLEHRYHSINEHVQYFFVKQANEEKAELERQQKRRQNGNGSDDEEEEKEDEEGEGGGQRENGGEGGGEGRQEDDASTDEQPVWQLAADMAAAKRKRLVVGNGAPRPFQQHQNNNKGATAETELLDGPASKKRVSFPELPPESPIPGAAVFLYQNGGPPCIGMGKRRRILSLVPSSSSTTCFSSPKLAKGRRMASMRMARLNHRSADLLQPQGPGRPSTQKNAPDEEESPSKGSSTAPDAPQQEKEEGGLCFEGEFIRVLSRLQEVIERNELRLVEKDRRNAEKLEWQQVALVLDRFLLVIFTGITIAVLLCTVFNSERSALW